MGRPAMQFVESAIFAKNEIGGCAEIDGYAARNARHWRALSLEVKTEKTNYVTGSQIDMRAGSIFD